MDKLDAMQTFVRVAEAGSFIAVANQLQIARSVVTRQIAALEKSLGTKLITRSTRSLTLTSAGSAYLEKCRLILNMVDAAESGLRQDKGEARGRIRLGLPLSFGLEVLMPLLLDFAQAQPRIELQMDLSDQRSNLVEEGMDLSIRVTSQLQPGDIVRRLGQCRLMTVASPAYWAAHGVPQQPEQLQHHPALVYAIGAQSMPWRYQADGQVVTVTVRGRISANNGAALMQAAARGMGVTVQPDFIANPWLMRGEVQEVLTQHAPEPLGIYAVLPSNRYMPQRVSLLIEHLAACLATPVSA
jgi:DNA-binding transcriptional LysR family regulator